jgi:hypothetical protein
MEKASETKTSRPMTALLLDCRAHGHDDLTAKAEMTLTNCANRRFQFSKGSQLVIRTHNEPLSVVAVRISNPGCAPVRIHG